MVRDRFLARLIDLVMTDCWNKDVRK